MTVQTELKIEWVEVTPEVAMTYLDSMTVNRPLSSANMKKIQADMVAGRWHEDGSPIRFSRDGHLIDGQHRMWAIAETGLTFRFLVMRGVEPAAMATMDTGKSRSISDIIGLYDPQAKDHNSLAATTTITYRWEAGVRGMSLRNFPIANDDLLRFYEENKLRLNEASRRGKRVATRVKGATAQAFSLCVYLFDALDQEDAEFFWERLIDGANLSEDSPILALRTLLDREAKSQRPSLRVDFAAALIIKAWNAYREGRPMRVLSYKQGGASPERFPEVV